jgi:hypothetical protein
MRGEGLLKSFWRRMHWISGAAPPWISTSYCKVSNAWDPGNELEGSNGNLDQVSAAKMLFLCSSVRNCAAHSWTVSECFHGVSFMKLRTHFPVMLGEYWVYVLGGIISMTILMLLYLQ